MLLTWQWAIHTIFQRIPSVRYGKKGLTSAIKKYFTHFATIIFDLSQSIMIPRELSNLNFINKNHIVARQLRHFDINDSKNATEVF